MEGVKISKKEILGVWPSYLHRNYLCYKHDGASCLASISPLQEQQAHVGLCHICQPHTDSSDKLRHQAGTWHLCSGNWTIPPFLPFFIGTASPELEALLATSLFKGLRMPVAGFPQLKRHHTKSSAGEHSLLLRDIIPKSKTKWSWCY